MKNYLLHDEWKIIEEGFNPEYNEISESCFSIGNGRFGQRANFEEQYSGKSLQGSYVAGVYYPDKTRVGWWKIGYPEYFAKVLNAPNWIGIDVQVDGEVLDLATAKVLSFRRELDMRRGVLIRNFQVKMVSGKELEVSSTRFCSMANTEVGAIRYEVKPLNFSGNILTGAETMINEIFVTQPGKCLAIYFKMIRLPADRLLPIEAKPSKVFINCVFKRQFTATFINVFNAEQKPT